MNILIAEDDRDAANVYLIALKSRGHEVTLVRNGLECLQAYKKKLNSTIVKNKDLQPYDAVVLDYRMPMLDGLETAKAIFEVNPQQRIIFASAYVRETLRDSVEDLKKIVELIEKPFEPKALTELIENVYGYQELKELNSFAIDMDLEQATISGKDILRGLWRMDKIFGTTVLDALIEELGKQGIAFEEGRRYSAGHLQSLLESALGGNVGIFLMRFFKGYFTKKQVDSV